MTEREKMLARKLNIVEPISLGNEWHVGKPISLIASLDVVTK